jgi:tRNA threonylcarbamoyladenosine biosynthesis protein TsaB
MLILGLDSASNGCNVCVWRDGQVLSLIEKHMERGQDQQLMPVVLQALEKAQVTFEQIDRIAVTRGPGSFTGLRIGLAATRGLGLALSKTVIGIDRFHIYREQYKSTTDNLLILIQSKRAELYCQITSNSADSPQTEMMTVTQIEDLLKKNLNLKIVGDGKSFADKIGRATEPEVATCVRLSATANPDDPDCHPSPLYIRAPDVSIQMPILQPMTSAMLPQLAAMHKASFGNNAWSVKQFQGSLNQSSTVGLTAFQNEQIAGFILCQIIDGQWEILTMCVDAPLSRRGIGEQLLREIMRRANTTQSLIYLEVAVDNVAAHSLYKKCRFMQTGLRKNYYRRDKGAVDAILMTYNP